MNGRSTVGPNRQGDSTTPIFLALYLIILAFFILLNAISHREEERSKAVLGSLGATFSQPALVATGPLDFAAGTGEFTAIGEFEESVRDLFQSAFPFVKVTPYQPFAQMQIEVPVESMFVPGGAELRAELAGFIGRLAVVLNRHSPSQYFEAELLIPLSPASARSATRERRNTVGRAAAFADALVDRGVPPNRVSAGIEEGDPTTLRILFFSRYIGADGV